MKTMAKITTKQCRRCYKDTGYVNLKLNKDNCHFRCTSVPYFGEVILRNRVQPGPQKIKALMEMLFPNNKKELLAFLGITDYLSKFSPSMASVYEPLWKLTSSGAVWRWNASYQGIYDRTKSLIKANAYMKFYDETKTLYLETDATKVGLGAILLQTRDGMTCPKCSTPDNTILQPIAFVSKSLTSADCRYSNIEWEALVILHGLEKIHHYCFARDVGIITDHKPLVAIFKKDVATLSQRIQCILLRIHQYRVRILYRPGPDTFIADWLYPHNHKEKRTMQYVEWT